MTIYNNTFEGGTHLGAITPGNSGGASGDAWQFVNIGTGGSAQYTTTWKTAGAFGAVINLGTGSTYFRWDKVEAGSRAVMRRPLIIPSGATISSTLVLMAMRNQVSGGQLMCNLVLRTNSKIRLQPNGVETLASESTVTLAADTLYWLEMACTKGTTTTNGRVEYRITLDDGTVVFTYDSGATVNTLTDDPGQYRFGGFTSTQVTGWTQDKLDDVRAGILASGWIGPMANAAPSVDAGANQNVAAAATVNLTGTASDVDGTIASQAWTFDYPTTGAPTLTGGTTLNASFTAGAAGSLYILRLTATDNGGLTAFDTVEIRVPTTGAIAPLPVAGTGTGTVTNTGGASSEGLALSDASDSTYLLYATATGTEINRRLRLQPASARTALTLTQRLSKSDSSACVAYVRLYEGTTLRQAWTQSTLTTSAADYTFALDPATISAITDWGALYLEVGQTT